MAMAVDPEVEAELRFLRWKLAHSRGAEYKAALKRYTELTNQSQTQSESYEVGTYNEGQPAAQSSGGGSWGGINSW